MPFLGVKSEESEVKSKPGPEVTSPDRPFILSCNDGDIIIFQLSIATTDENRKKMEQRVFKLLPKNITDVDIFVLNPGQRIHIHDPNMIDFIINDVMNPGKDKEG